MALGDIVGKLTGGMDLGGLLSGATQGITVLFGVILIILFLGVIGYIYWNAKRYSRKIIIAKKIGGSFVFAGNDVARTVKIGDMGNEILYLKKAKAFRSTRGILINKNTYLFVIDKEGNWLNVGLSDVNKDLDKLGYEIPSNDMRMSNVSIRRLNEKQFEKTNWFKENVGIFVGAMVIILVLIFMWLLASKYFTIFDSQRGILEEQKKLNEQNTDMVRAVTNLVEKMSVFGNGGASLRTTGT